MQVFSTDLQPTSISWSLLRLLVPPLESLPNPSSCGLGCCIPDSLIAEHVGSEFSLGFGKTGSGSTIIAVNLCEHEEVRQCRDTKSNGNAKDEETDEISATGGPLVREGTDSGYDATPTRAGNTEGHNHGEDELAEEYEEEEHKVETRVVAEGLVGGPEPAEERERDEEDAVDNSKPKLGAFVHSREKVTEPPKDVKDHQK